MQIASLGHLVLTVKDIEATCDFYTRVLGMQAVTFGTGRKALQFGDQKINLHHAGKEFEPKALKPTQGSGDICLITHTPLEGVIEHIHACAVEIVKGPVQKMGARGPITSVYVRDPDGILIEIANYITTSVE